MGVKQSGSDPRVDLAAALRQAWRMGLSEGVCNHFSLAVPDREGLFYINPQGLHWSEVRAADIVTVDVDGKIVAGHHFVEPTAFFIHSRIHRARPDAKCVLHTHMPFATALTLLEDPTLEPVSQTSLKFFGRIAYDTVYNGLALDAAEGDRMVSALGDANVMFLANHGVIVCGETVAWTFDDLYYLERAAMAQVLAASTGRKLKQIDARVAAATALDMETDEQRLQSELLFAALKRQLDRDDPRPANPLWSSLTEPSERVLKPDALKLPPLARLAWR
jgi:ribulose-5-phosphate 4-epimerase/fuculose-1-phosphate aldolase